MLCSSAFKERVQVQTGPSAAGYVVDSQGRRVRLHCVNWPGTWVISEFGCQWHSDAYRDEQGTVHTCRSWQPMDSTVRQQDCVELQSNVVLGPRAAGQIARTIASSGFNCVQLTTGAADLN